MRIGGQRGHDDRLCVSTKAYKKKTQMKNCIITGGSGFIGSHLIQHLLDNELYSTIFVLDLVPPRVTEARLKYFYCDIRKPIDVHLPDTADICIHLAALCKEPGFDWDEYFLTNFDGTCNVCKWLDHIGVDKLVFTSTMMTYRAGEKRNTEDSNTSPDTAYGISKLLAELAIDKWASSAEGRIAKSIRLGVVFGKWENGNYTRLYRALRRRLFFYIGRKNTVKASLYVKDAVRFMIHIIKNDTRYNIYNLAYNREDSIEDICQAFAKQFGTNMRLPTIPYRLALSAAYFFELLNFLGINNGIHHRRIQKLYQSTNISSDRALSTGFEFQYDVNTGLADWQIECDGADLF